MSDTGSVVGSAFIEVHARAAASLEREIEQNVNAAASRVQPPRVVPPASKFEPFAAQAEGISSVPTAADIAMLKNRAREQEKLIEEAYEFGRAESAAAAMSVDANKRVEGAVKKTAAAHDAAGASIRKYGSQLLNGAAIYLVVNRATAVARATLGEFIKAGDEGRLKSEEDVRAYRQLSNGLDGLSAAWGRAKEAAGRFAATNVSTSNFEKGIIALNNPLATLSAQLGFANPLTRDLARQFGAVKDANPAETVAEVARRVDQLAESAARYAKEFDARTDATIRAVGIEFEQIGANDRLWRAQEKVNEVRARGADTARRLADAERDINEARQAAADAAQNATERDRALAEARRKLRIVQFEQGVGSQAALDAADAVQEAEFDAVRAHQEAADAVLDVAKAQRKAADDRIRANDELEDAEQALQDAQRQSARTSADLQAAMREASGETVTGTEKLRLYLAELDKFSGTGGKVQAEIDIIKRALETLPSPSGLDAATERMLAELGRVYSQGFAPGFNPNAPPAGFVDPGAPTPITLSPPPVQITNIFNTPVDPAQIAREQAAQIGATPSPQRLFS